MNCTAARRQLTGAQASSSLERHLVSCTGCRDFALRLDSVRSGLRGHHAGATPDPSFASRVSARLQPAQPVEVLGWAAVRLLPVSLVVALVLAWVAWMASPEPASSPVNVAEISADPLDWLFDSSEDSP